MDLNDGEVSMKEDDIFAARDINLHLTTTLYHCLCVRFCTMWLRMDKNDELCPQSFCNPGE